MPTRFFRPRGRLSGSACRPSVFPSSPSSKHVFFTGFVCGRRRACGLCSLWNILLDTRRASRGPADLGTTHLGNRSHLLPKCFLLFAFLPGNIRPTFTTCRFYRGDFQPARRWLFEDSTIPGGLFFCPCCVLRSAFWRTIPWISLSHLKSRALHQTFIHLHTLLIIQLFDFL